MTSALDSWTDGPTKSAIVDFVARVSDESGPDFVEPAARVAVFDNDGTLWCEKPMPIQLDFTVRRLAEMARDDPSLQQQQPWKAAYENDLHWMGAAMVKHYHGDDEDIRALMGAVTRAFDTVTVEEYDERVRAFFVDSGHPTLGRPYRSCGYAPMVELLRYLEDHGFTNYIASGGDRDFMRPVAGDLYGVPPERVIGSALGLTYAAANGETSLVYKAAMDFFDDGPEKPIRIWSRIGRRPILSGRQLQRRPADARLLGLSRPPCAAAAAAATTTPSASSTTSPAPRMRSVTAEKEQLDRREHEERLERGVRADGRITNDYAVVGVPVVLITNRSRRSSQIDVRRDGIDADPRGCAGKSRSRRQSPGTGEPDVRNRRRALGSRSERRVPCAGTLVPPSTRDLRALNSASLIAPESSSVLALAISSAGGCWRRPPGRRPRWPARWPGPAVRTLCHAAPAGDQVDDRGEERHEDQADDPDRFREAARRLVAEKVGNDREHHHEVRDERERDDDEPDDVPERHRLSFQSEGTLSPARP